MEYILVYVSLGVLIYFACEFTIFEYEDSDMARAMSAIIFWPLWLVRLLFELFLKIFKP